MADEPDVHARPDDRAIPVVGTPASLPVHNPPLGTGELADILAAIHDGQMVPHYQPLVSLGSRRIIGVEALARWHRPGVVGERPPSEFVPHLEDRVNPMLEIALLADGVPFDKLYPLDVDRALRKLDPIKKNAVWWTTNSQSQQLMIDGECVLGILNNGRIYDAVQKGAKIGIEWAQNLQSVDYLVVPKGSKV
jgi:hypothetical protein